MFRANAGDVPRDRVANGLVDLNTALLGLIRGETPEEEVDIRAGPVG